MSYIDMEKVAAELGITTADALREAQTIMDQRFNTGGIDAITGLSTGTRVRGSVSIATVSADLAKLLREAHS